MHRIYIVLVLLLAIAGLGSPHAQGQSLTPFVVSSAGGAFTASSGITLMATVGEMSAVSTYVNNGGILTQGFEQPGNQTQTFVEALPSDFATVSVYPNPSAGLFHVRLGDAGMEAASFSVFSALGREVFSGKVPATPVVAGEVLFEVPLRGLQSGTYLLEIRSASRVLIAKQLLHLIL